MPPTKKVEIGAVAQQVARRLSAIRESRRLTYAEISARLESYGRPIPVLGLRRIERGERRIDIDDVIALAYALEVPPLSLLFDMERDEESEVLPNRRLGSRSAAWWFTGETRLPRPMEEFNQLYGRGDRDPQTGIYEWYEDPYTTEGKPLRLLREHRDLIRRWVNRESEEAAWARFTNSDKIDELRIAWLGDRLQNKLRQNRENMRQLGMKPPKLPEDLAHLEQES